MSKQRKFTNQLDIEAEILKQRRAAVRQHELAVKHESKMHAFWDVANDPEVEAGKQSFNRQKGFDQKKLMERNLKLLKRIEDVKLPKLKHALASFKTQAFAFAEDKSVVIN